MLAGWMSATGAEGEDARAAPDVDRGQYLATLLGCMGCHTEGFFTRGPFGAPFAGSKVGITYTGGENPAVVFPSNLTPDWDTGIGRWSIDDIARAIRRGTHMRGGGLSHVMPANRFGDLDAADAAAIARYLKTLTPVVNRIPKPVPEGTPSSHPYVYVSTTFHDPP